MGKWLIKRLCLLLTENWKTLKQTYVTVSVQIFMCKPFRSPSLIIITIDSKRQNLANKSIKLSKRGYDKVY